MSQNENNPFKILTPEVPQAVTESDKTLPLPERIKNLIGSSDVFLFMKGNPAMPQCGFSANVVGMLNHLQVPFKTFDILSDMDIRQGVKEFSNWPTYPQLYVRGELIGGNDIVMEMFENGELQSVIKGEA